MIPALVLSAGLGTRLDPLTRLVAKPAVPLGGQTLIERVLSWLHREGVRDVVVNLHHRPQSLTAILGDGAHLGLRIRYSWEQPILGSAGGPRHALPLLESNTFLIVNGDTLCEFPLVPMVEAHRARRAAITMAVVPNPKPDHYNGVALDAEDRITGFVPMGPAAHASWHFVAAQVANADVFASLRDGEPAETVSGLYRERLAGGDANLWAWRTGASFIDVGTVEGYLEAALSFAPLGASVVERGAEVDGTARLTRSVVWRGARIAAHAQLDECIVLSGTEVPVGFAGFRSVLAPATAAQPTHSARIISGVAVFPL